MRIITLVAISASLCTAQTWTGILPASRAVDWSHAGLPATLPDGEVTANPWTPPARTQYGSTVTPSGTAATDLSNINTALSNCTNGKYVLLGTGNFLIQGTVLAYLHSCTLRGSGPQSTTLQVSGSGAVWLGASSSGGSCVLTSGSNFAAGSTNLTCNSLAGGAPAVGDIIALTQCDTGYSGTPCTGTSADNGGLYVCGDNVACESGSNSGPQEHQAQTVTAISVANNSGVYTIGISSPVYMPNWSFSRTPTISWNDRSYNGVGVGLENLTIYQTSSTQNSTTIMANTVASWVNGVRFISSANVIPVNVGGSYHALIANNYFFPGAALDGNYPPPMQFGGTSDSLVLNNIMASGVPWEGTGENVGNVVAYNYSRDSFTSYVENNFFDHHAYSSFDLFEGNQTGTMLEDNTWGTHGLNTYFRNDISCWDSPYNAPSPRGMAVDKFHRFENLIGNTIGTSGQCTTYQGTGDGSVFRLDTSDPLVVGTLMRWGNCDTVTGTCRFQSSEVPSSLASPNASLAIPVPSTNNVPASFFMPVTAHTTGGTGLSWWRVCTAWTAFPATCSAASLKPFPAAGPDVSGGAYVNGHAHDIPAAIAWLNLPVDATYQNSYTITASSWSGGTETLTISSPPDVTHLMGAFQLSGVNSACTTGATINAANEILITNSNSTTVSYALAGNPGVSCTGTFKFPDVRQFDESVYQTDSPAGSSVSSKAVLKGAVIQ